MKSIIFLSFAVLLFACSSTRTGPSPKEEKRNWITAYKNTVFIGCLMAHDSTIMKQDVSASLNTDFLGDYGIIRHADSLGRAYYQQIKPSPILDLQQKKLVIDEALEFYSSKTLDSIARSEYAAFQRNMKNAY